jgi:LmbE family N-acetylglucosaminyl deacetylase
MNGLNTLRVTTASDLTSLGTVLTVWAHPDDETYLAGGVLARLSDAGQRVVCVTATRGEAADPAVAPSSTPVARSRA